MELKDVVEFIEANKADQEVLDYLESLKGEIKYDVDVVRQLAEEDADVKALIESLNDKHTNKALETWKANNLEKLVNEEIRQRFPEKDEKDIALQELQARIETMEREKTFEKLKNVALKTATEKGLPVDIVEYFIGNDEDATIANLSTLEEVFKSKLEDSIKSRLNEVAYTPPGPGKSNADYTVEEMGKLSEEEINTYIESKISK